MYEQDNIREKLNNQIKDSLFNTVEREYSGKSPITRILYLAKIHTSEDENEPKPEYSKKEKKQEDKNLIHQQTIATFIKELKDKLDTFSSHSNWMLIFTGVSYAFVGIENTTENIMKLLMFLKTESKMTTNAFIINYIEECPNSMFPIYYKYEGSLEEKESQLYRDMSISEKGWELYDNFFCGLGKEWKKWIRTEEDFLKNAKMFKEEEAKYVKFLPTMNEINVFMSDSYPSLTMFIEMFMNEIEVNWDDDEVYPYYWPMNCA